VGVGYGAKRDIKLLVVLSIAIGAIVGTSCAQRSTLTALEPPVAAQQ